MNFAELLDSWIAEKINKALTDHAERIFRLEQSSNSPAMLAERVQWLEDRDFVTRSQVEDKVSEALSVTDWDDCIGSFVAEKVESVLSEDDFRDAVGDLLDDKIENLTFEVSVK